MNKSFVILILFVGSLLTACGPNVVFNQTKVINESGWTYENILQYDFDITDTAKLYNLFLVIEHSTDFTTQNLYAKIHTGFPNGEKIDQQLSIDFANKIGRWHGDCNKDACKLEIPIQTNAYFNQLGTHQFMLEQFMRTSPLKEIKKVSFRIEESNKSRI